MAEDKAIKAAWLAAETQRILALKPDFKVERLTDFQYRIDERLDLYPVSRRYHHLGTEKRGSYTDARAIAEKFLGTWKHHRTLEDN